MPSDPSNSHAALTKEGLLERLHAAFDCAKYSGEADALFDLAGERVFFREDGDIGPVLDAADRASHWDQLPHGLFHGQTLILHGNTRAFAYFLAALLNQLLVAPDTLDEEPHHILLMWESKDRDVRMREIWAALSSVQRDVFRDVLIYAFRRGAFWYMDAARVAPWLGVPASALVVECGRG
ncbi:MAG: hypothetical protein IPM64_10845 [Phycisphaerales bacterium]|nr:hypothetical protein [Phycisphaerales bacterium]